MSAVLQQDPQTDSEGGVEVTRTLSGQAASVQAGLLTPAALAFLAGLHRRFEGERRARLSARAIRQARFDAGALPDFRADTAAIRNGDWRVAPIPAALQDRRVEITGPVDPKMVINALNSGANCYMADFEDSTAPTWANLLTGQQALREAIAGSLHFAAPAADGAPGKSYTPIQPIILGDNARTLVANDRGPYFYLPKLQSMEEAALWDAVLAHIERELGLAQGQLKATVLIETLPAAFEMDEILHALKDRIVGLNCGRWDYIFSYLKTFRRHRDRVLPERAQVGMTQPFLKAYSELLIKTCHRRGAHAMGGMAAQIPISGDAEANEAALARVRADKLREVTAGHDGTWVAHPALIPLAREIFDAHMPEANQRHVLRDDVEVTRDTLIKPSLGTITRAGFENNVEVCVRYLAAWLDGNGCVPIHWLMEDAATAEIARAQLWQWLHFDADPDRPGRQPLCLDDGTPVDFALLERALIGLPGKFNDQLRMPGASRINEAIGMLDRLTHAEVLADFLTLPAYERID